MRIYVLGAALLALVGQCRAHSFVERLVRIALNGTMAGSPGYPRGWISRESTTYSDINVEWLLPPNGRSDGKVLHADDKVARPSQKNLNYTTDFPMLKASAGDLIALQYQENGHVTLPQNQPNKPLNRGTVYVYGTTDFDPEANLLDILYKWTPDGTGGDGKGTLLATRNFDDGQCYQVNGGTISTERQAKFSKPAEDPMGTNLWCQSDVALPSDLATSTTYTLIWIWDWPTMDRADVPDPPSSAPGAAAAPGGATVQTPEIYTTVMDVQVVDPCDKDLGEAEDCHQTDSTASAFKFVSGQDLNTAAISEQCTKAFLVDYSAVYADSVGTASPASGSSSATDTLSTAPSSSVVAQATPPSSDSFLAGGRIKTETVYGNIQTVTVTAAVGASESISMATASTEGPTFTTSSSTRGPPTVSRFMGPGRKARRGAYHI